MCGRAAGQRQAHAIEPPVYLDPSRPAPRRPRVAAAALLPATGWGLELSARRAAGRTRGMAICVDARPGARAAHAARDPALRRWARRSRRAAAITTRHSPRVSRRGPRTPPLHVDSRTPHGGPTRPAAWQVDAPRVAVPWAPGRLSRTM